MDKKHAQTLLSYCAELARYTSLIEKELTKPSQMPENQTQEIIGEKKIESIAFFTYSLMLPDSTEEDNNVLVIGDFIIRNIGNETLHAPVICLRISPASAGSLSGKIRNRQKRNALRIEATTTNEWRYIEANEGERENQGEYWITPSFLNELAPDHTLVFPGFTLNLVKPLEGNSVIVEGFVYFKEQSKGIASLNNIVINF
jgi:hypothetical protein